jgi:hypothetical protein
LARQQEIANMARKPNYNFERMERERIKAAKSAEKANAKREQRERERLEAEGPAQPTGDDADEA